MKRTALILCLLAQVASAHPVAYKGAWDLMFYNQPDMQDWQLLYTFYRKVSFGLNLFHDRMETQERYYLLPRLSWLVNRWNGEDYQANLYLYGGAGAAYKQGRTTAAAEGGLEADFETRKFYIAAKAMGLVARELNTMALYQGRIGFAPYVAEAGAVHTWIFGQVQYLPYAPEELVRVGPVIRFFYQNVLWEMGVSARGTWTLNFMTTF